MNNVLVTGSGGQVGQALQRLAGSQPALNWIFSHHQQLDICDRDALVQFCRQQRIDAVINCAAYTAVDLAETETVQAQRVNHLAVQHLADVAGELDLALLHLSSDYVFSGQACRPYLESDVPNPQSAYGLSKWQGEQAMLKLNPPRSAIIRTSWVYSPYGNNFVKTMLRLGRERSLLQVVDDQIGTPTYALDLAAMLLHILPQLTFDHTEIYHYSNEGVCSWYDFAKVIFNQAHVACEVLPIPSSAYPTPAQRPAYSLLNKRKIKQQFGLAIPYWQDSLAHCLQALAAGEAA